MSAEDTVFHRAGIGAKYGYNFDGEMYKDSQSIDLLYQYNQVQFNLGVKHYEILNESEYIIDLGLLYSIYDGNVFDLKVGVGMEDKYPTIEYVAEYALNNHLGINIGLNQVLNDDLGENQREAVLGLSYYFYDSNSEIVLTDSVTRPYSLAAGIDESCKMDVPDNECELNISAKKQGIKISPEPEPEPELKPKLNLPYVVKEGDWLYQLRRDYDFDLEEIVENNNIEDPDLILPGQVLE